MHLDELHTLFTSPKVHSIRMLDDVPAGPRHFARASSPKDEQSKCPLPATTMLYASAVRIVEVFVPAPRHKQRSGMSDAYHARVQKKWDRRLSTTVQKADGPAVSLRVSSALLTRLKTLASK
jgi:hypothetical protein